MTIDLDKFETLARAAHDMDGLTGPEMIIRHRAFIEGINPAVVLQWIAETRALQAEAFSLAASQCHGGYGDDHGNWRCNYQDKLRVAVEALKQAQLVVMEFATRMDVPPEDEETRAMMKRIGNGVTKALATLSAPTGDKVTQ